MTYTLTCLDCDHEIPLTRPTPRVPLCRDCRHQRATTRQKQREAARRKALEKQITEGLVDREAGQVDGQKLARSLVRRGLASLAILGPMPSRFHPADLIA